MYFIRMFLVYFLFLTNVYSSTPSIEDVFNYFKSYPLDMKEGKQVTISNNVYLVSMINIYYLSNKNQSDVEPFYHARMSEQISATFFERKASEEYLEFDVRILLDGASFYGKKRWKHKATRAPGYYSENGVFNSNDMCYRLNLTLKK